MADFLISIGGDPLDRAYQKMSAIFRVSGYQPQSVEIGVTPGMSWAVAAHLSCSHRGFMAQHSLLAAQPKAGAIGQVRLDDRGCLERKLKESSSLSDGRVSDIEIVSSAWSSYGNAIFDWIEGDYALIFFSNNQSSLTVARDPFGTAELYYSELDNGAVVISNSIVPLLAFDGIPPVVDDRAMVDFLLSGSINHWDKSLTPYKHIHQVVPGSLVTFSSTSRLERKFWRFPSARREFSNLKGEEIGEVFNQVLSSAVEDRLREKRVVLMLSGGLDSTSVAVAAADVMVKAESVVAMTAVGSPDDIEGKLAGKVSKSIGMPHSFHAVLRKRPFEDWVSSPFPTCNFYNTHLDSLRCQSELGDYSLNACSADFMLSPDPMSLVGVFRHFGPMDGLRTIGLLLANYGFLPILPDPRKLLFPHSDVRPSASNLKARTGAAIESGPPKWLNPSFSAMGNSRRQLDWKTYQFNRDEHCLRPRARAAVLKKDRLAMRGCYWPSGFVPARFGDPFLDRRVIEFLWSLPPLPWFHRKHLLRFSMASKLPKEVINRPKTPARKWVDRTYTEYLTDWFPGEESRRFFVTEELPRSFTRDTLPRDFHPVFLDFWMRDAQARIKSLRKEVNIASKTMT